MPTFEIQISDDKVFLSCPFCDRKVNLLVDECPHLLIRHDTLGGGYSYLRADLKEMKGEFDQVDMNYYLNALNELKAPFREDDLIFKFSDDAVGIFSHVVIRRDLK